MKMKFYFSSLLVVAGLAMAMSAQASITSGTLTTGLSTGPTGVVTAPPTATPGAGTYTSAQNVVLTGDDATVSIHFTTDGVTAPTCTSGTVYSSAISVATSTTISALSCYTGSASSAVASFAYVINAQASTAIPTANPPAGTYTSAQSVTLTAEGSQNIHYTLDGTTPSCDSGTAYISAISVSASETIKALSCYPNNVSSGVATFAYVINIPTGGGGTTGSTGTSGGTSGGDGGGAATSGTISGFIFSDVNADGIYTAPTDTPLSGWTVYLDTNENGVLDAGDKASTTSDTLGNYSFGNLVLNTTYTVREIVNSGWGQTLPHSASSNHSYTVNLTPNIPNAQHLDFGNNAQGRVLGTSTTNAHSDGTLILDGSTVYLIAGGQLHGFRDSQEFASYGYKFSQTVPASPADLLLPQGDIMKAMTGTLTLDTSDNRTIYMVGKNYTKRGFVSMAVYRGLGYVKGSSTSGQAMHGLFKINMTDYPAGDPIASSTAAHPEGALVLDGTTVWWILDGKRSGFESITVFNTYGFTFDRVVPANASDLALPVGLLVKLRDGTLVLQGGVTYIISDGLKLPFASDAALTSRGYNPANVVAADVSGYTLGATLN
jgi:hypothetical protein